MPRLWATARLAGLRLRPKATRMCSARVKNSPCGIEIGADGLGHASRRQINEALSRVREVDFFSRASAPVATEFLQPWRRAAR